MAERKACGQECGQALAQAQELEKYLTNDELAALIEVLEEPKSAKAYLVIKTAELWRAWIKHKLTALGIEPSFLYFTVPHLFQSECSEC